MVTDVGNQCQMVNANSFVDNQFMMGPSMTFMGINFGGILYVLTLYTVGVLLIGYGCGYRIIRRKTLNEKMTMTPVTYTAVRKVQHHRFEFSTTIDGCW